MSPKYLLAIAALLANNAWAIDASHRQYADVKKFMDELVQSHPQTTRHVIIGASDNGELIEAVAIGNGATHNLVVATHHGNEYGSTEVGIAFAAALADKPIVDQTVYVIPVLNIAGYNAKQREESSNGHYHDPNRDYPGPCGTEGPHKLKSTAALASFIERENIVASATLHTSYPTVVYPWGLPTVDVGTPYDDIFKILVNNATEWSHYTVGNTTNVIYPAAGSYEDYAFWKHGAWSILFELGYSHTPSQKDIDEMIRINVPGIRKMLEQAPKERAMNHDFTGQCQRYRMAKFDRHDE